MRYPAIVVLVLGGIALLAWWASGRRMPLAIHITAAVLALLTGGFLLWIRRPGVAVEPELWLGVVIVPTLVYANFAFYRVFLAGEKPADAEAGAAMPKPAPPPLATEAWVPEGPGGPLTPEEKARAAQLQVWPVWWQLPDKDWEALCLRAEDAEQLFEARQQDHLLKTWGRVGKREPQALLAWLEANARAASGSALEDRHRVARELLRRLETTEKEPLTLRTW